VKQSLSLAKKKANRSEDIKFNIVYDTESEDLHYNIEWIKVVIQGPKEKEQEEYNEAMKLYEPMVNIFKKEFPKDEKLSRVFNTKMLSPIQLEKAYKEGHGAINDSNMAQKLLEMGIITNVEIISDY
jgi:hypothetical protein